MLIKIEKSVAQIKYINIFLIQVRKKLLLSSKSRVQGICCKITSSLNCHGHCCILSVSLPCIVLLKLILVIFNGKGLTGQ